MADRPYTLLSCCVSLDGFLAGPTNRRLLLSNDADLDRVDAVRAGCDAILVGAATVRCDNPRLLVRSESRRRARQAAGRSPSPVKVTLTRGGCLDPNADFFTAGDGLKLVYSPDAAPRLSDRATVVTAGEPVDLRWMVGDLHQRGVHRLMVEGGASLHTQFLATDLVDELQLAVAPFFVGDARARRFVGNGAFPFHPGRRATLAQVSQIGDVALLRYALSERYVD